MEEYDNYLNPEKDNLLLYDNEYVSTLSNVQQAFENFKKSQDSILEELETLSKGSDLKEESESILKDFNFLASEIFQKEFQNLSEALNVKEDMVAKQFISQHQDLQDLFSDVGIKYILKNDQSSTPATTDWVKILNELKNNSQLFKEEKAELIKKKGEIDVLQQHLFEENRINKKLVSTQDLLELKVETFQESAISRLTLINENVSEEALLNISFSKMGEINSPGCLFNNVQILPFMDSPLQNLSKLEFQLLLFKSIEKWYSQKDLLNEIETLRKQYAFDWNPLESTMTVLFDTNNLCKFKIESDYPRPGAVTLLQPESIKQHMEKDLKEKTTLTQWLSSLKHIFDN